MKKIDEGLFEYADEQFKNELENFIVNNPIKNFKQGQHDIDYYDAGQGDKLLMLIPSSNGGAITFYKYIEVLSQSCRVIVPNYHAGVDLQTQCRGFLELAKSIDHKAFYVFGYSFGGIVAQLMAKYDPQTVDGISFLDSETKTKHINPKLVKRFVKSYKRLDRTLRFFSEKWMHKSLAKRISFDVVAGLDDNKHFWEGLYKQVLFETSRERMKMIYDNVREFWMNYELSPEDFSNYKGKVLILNIEGSLQRVEVKELTELFKGAEEVVYSESFRMSLVTCYNNVLEDLKAFIE